MELQEAEKTVAILESAFETRWAFLVVSATNFAEVFMQANAIISASRQEMIGSTLYLTGIDVDSQDYVQNSCSCSMCKRLIINAGIKDVVIRDSKDKYRIIPVQEWIDNDESLNGKLGY